MRVHYLHRSFNVFTWTGFNPCWNETLQFPIHTPELALVRFVVEDYDKTSRNDFIGQYTLPFSSIQPGMPFQNSAQINLNLCSFFSSSLSRVPSCASVIKRRNEYLSILPVCSYKNHRAPNFRSLINDIFTNEVLNTTSGFLKSGDQGWS